MLKKIDTYIVEKFEKFAHICQRIFGVTNYFLAALCMIVSASVCTLKWSFPEKKFDALSVFFDAIYLVFAISIVFLLIPFYERSARNTQQRGLANPLKVARSFQLLRVASCILTIYELIFLVPEYNKLTRVQLANAIDITFFSMYLVFIACDPLPPSRDEKPRWVNVLFSKPSRSA